MPLPSKETDDAVMAPAPYVQDMQNWVAEAFAGKDLRLGVPPVRLKVLRQDHNVLAFGQSCMDTPVVIGKQQFEHGLGVHAVSKILVTVPAGAKSFHAQVGVDNNFDTQGRSGSVGFSIELGGKEVYRSQVLKGGEEPVAVSLDLPKDARELMLNVDDGGDGVSNDQADWADACFAMEDGSRLYLDQGQSRLMFRDTTPPFSFIFGDRSSAELLPNWKRDAESKEQDDAVVHTVRWTDPESQLQVTAVAKAFKQYPAADWVLYFENKGKNDTPLLENIQAIDAVLRTGLMRTPATLHQLNGDACGETTFLPKEDSITGGQNIHRAPTGGRPSSISAFPFFNFQYLDRGLIAAVGWTGQWAATFDRAGNGPTRFTAGMELTHLVLHPGERIRTPRIVVMPWEGDRLLAHNRFRRLVLFHYVPKHEGTPTPMPTSLQTFDRYNARPGWATEAGQIEAVETAHKLGCNTYWLDAAWFPGNFPNGVGNWFCKPEEFPNGLKPVSDACHKHGMRFVLWFEPERVAKGTAIAKEHPEWVYGGENGGLFKLNDPDARRFLTDLLSQRITEYGIDIYRNDFNMDPLDSWRANDAAEDPSGNRQGMTEIRYVEGLYEMWDELLAKHPGLLIDNCSSGGRRIDIEMCSRSVPFWRSDTNCWAGHPDWNQSQTAHLNMYVPLHLACSWEAMPYEVRSAATSGFLCQFAYKDPAFPFEQAQRLIAEAKTNQPYWYGDFYPLTPAPIAPDAFVAYQFHRPDLNAGLVLAFRRANCQYFGLILGLNGILPDAQYRVEFVNDAGETKNEIMPGSRLQSDLTLRIPDKTASLVVRYTIEAKN